MKTILLTSSGSFVTEYASDFLPNPLSQSKIAYITTASKGVEDTTYLENHKKRMAELKWDVEKIHINPALEDGLHDIWWFDVAEVKRFEDIKEKVLDNGKTQTCGYDKEVL